MTLPDGPQDVDYILDNFVGGGHWWQWRTTLVSYLNLVNVEFNKLHFTILKCSAITY